MFLHGLQFGITIGNLSTCVELFLLVYGYDIPAPPVVALALPLSLSLFPMFWGFFGLSVYLSLLYMYISIALSELIPHLHLSYKAWSFGVHCTE
jgi:hypothetical protein